MMARIKKNDTVCIRAGKDRGKKGVVIAILPKKDKVMVKGIALIKRHVKPRKDGDIMVAGGIREQESYISLSKVMPLCGACHKACRVNVKSFEDGKVVRMCNRCKETF